MFSRLLGVPVLLGAAVGVPYVATNGPNIDGLFQNSAANSAPDDSPAAIVAQVSATPVRPPVPQGPGSTLYPTATPLEGLPVLSLQEVFNLNVTKEWVYQRWSRKSTALSELGLYGIRVPLVTGTQLHDLAGSLTYYFGQDGQVHRISFHGTTADTTQLVLLVARQYGLQQQTTPVAGEQLFQIRRNSQVFSELRTRPAPVLWASSPHDSFTVDFELQHPSLTSPLPSHLPPLPELQVAPAEQQRTAAAGESAAKKEAEVAESKKPVDPAEKWKPFFPRSRVPAKQVQGLERRGRLW